MNHTNHVPKKEWMAYCVGALGQGMVYAIMSSYISDFYISVLKLTPLFVLLLMLLARVWDAINDPIMGYIMDHANPKNGKMKPYLIYTPIPIAILTVLLFYAPNISDTAKMIYAAVTYVAWGMIYTASDVPFWALPNALTPNADERGGIISKARTANGVGSAVPTAFFMVLGFILPKFNLSGTELEKTKYMCIALFCAIVGNLLFIRVYFKTKERVNIPIPPKKDKNQPSALKLIFTCKPLMLTALMGILSAARYMYQAGAVHAARYSFYIGKDLTGLSAAEQEAALQGNISLVSTVFSVASAVGMFGAMLRRIQSDYVVHRVSAFLGLRAVFGTQLRALRRHQCVCLCHDRRLFGLHGVEDRHPAHRYGLCHSELCHQTGSGALHLLYHSHVHYCGPGCRLH